MQKVAIVGFGFMGKTHYGCWRKLRGAKVVAICDKLLSQLTTKVEGNIAGVVDNTRVPKSVKIYEDLDTMLKAGGFDIVDITLPTLLHADVAVKALKAGCHVFCEKPMALTIAECDRMLKAAKAAKRKLMIAHVARFNLPNRYLAEVAKSGKFGKLVAADFTRFIAPPKWSPKGADWFLDEAKSGGCFLDVHIHDTDLVRSIFGEPKRIVTEVHRNAKKQTDHVTSIFRYGSAVVTVSGSFSAPSSLSFDQAYRVFFEKAAIYSGGRFGENFVVYPDEGKPFTPGNPEKVNGYAEEVKYFLGYVEGRNDGSFMTAKSARDSIALAYREKSAAKI